MERPVKDNQHVLCQETCRHNNCLRKYDARYITKLERDALGLTKTDGTEHIQVEAVIHLPQWRGGEEGVDLEKGRSVGHCF